MEDSILTSLAAVSLLVSSIVLDVAHESGTGGLIHHILGTLCSIVVEPGGRGVWTCAEIALVELLLLLLLFFHEYYAIVVACIETAVLVTDEAASTV